jgi:hypothetical protein
MDAAQDIESTWTLPRRSMRCLVRILRCTGDVRHKDRLEPQRRGSSIAPVINGALGCISPRHNVRRAPLQNKLRPGHGRIVKEKCGFRNLILAIGADSAQITHMTTRYLIQYELDGQWITCATRKTFDAAKAKAKAERKAMNGAHETSVIREGDPECLRRKTCELFQLA